MPAFLLIAGVVTGLAVYGWMVSEFSAKAASFDLEKLPKMESASIILDRSGQQIGKIFIQNRLPIAYEQIPKEMVNAVVAEEDNRFFEHHGVDYLGVLRAAVSNYRQGRVKQGASTVTQQLARNSFDLKERSYRRKLLEMFVAQRIEDHLSKEKIMELYLNRVYFGSGFYGVESAARGYFGKPAKDLSVGECAMLAGLLKSPNALSPWNNLKGAKRVRDFVLTRMREMRLISREEYQGALESSLSVRKRTNPNRVSYAIDLVRQQAIAALGFDRAMNDGVRIYTTLDGHLLQLAEKALRSNLEAVEKRPGYNHLTYEGYRQANQKTEAAAQRGEPVTLPAPGYLQGAVLAVDNATGGILAVAGGRDFLHSEYNRAIQGRRPPGTLFTPMVAAAAYAKGIFPGDPVDDACIDNRFVMIGGDNGILGEWGVERADNDYEGPMPSHEAVARGKNAAVVRLGFKTGLDDLGKLCNDAGIRSPLRDVANAYLGSSEMSLDELTLAYTSFAGQGTRPAKLFTISSITDEERGLLYENPSSRLPVLPPQAAYQVHTVLQDALFKSCSREAGALGLSTNMPLAGKSGTSYDFTDLWFVGYSSTVTCGVWVGFDKPQKVYRGAFGKDLAFPIWAQVMNTTLASFPPKPLPVPAGLKSVEICRSSGLLPAEACRKTPGLIVTEYATEAQLSNGLCDIHGGGVRNYSKDIDQDEWPRAAAAVDLTRVRPVTVSAPTLLAQNDLYRAVNPVTSGASVDDGSIKVARATSPDGKDPGVQGAAEITNVASALPAGEKEVRRAEAVRPMDLPTGMPVLTIPAPKPAEF
ncbi:MAG: transglycosylase domain-containing protein [Verrucomicrobia bacterium]|nr:transglycosylase domain-containing protein [Verrucomicrobiota bacterium]